MPYQANATITAVVTDATSGPASTSVSAQVSTTRMGNFSVQVTAADVAGNTTTVSCSYSVGPVVIPTSPRLLL